MSVLFFVHCVLACTFAVRLQYTAKIAQTDTPERPKKMSVSILTGFLPFYTAKVLICMGNAITRPLKFPIPI